MSQQLHHYTEFDSIKSDIFKYRYLNIQTWQLLEQAAVKLISLLKNENSFNLEMKKVILIIAFHYIWNKRDFQIAQQLIRNVFKNDSELDFDSIIYYFQGKANFLSANYDAALTCFAQAESLIQQAANIDEILLAMGSSTDVMLQVPDQKILTTVIHNDRGNVFTAQGRYDDAIQQFSAVLALQEKIYGTKAHPNVLYTLRSLTDAYLMQKNLAMAKTILQQLKALCSTVYRSSDLNTEQVAIEMLQTKINHIAV